jgi:hypothetical protein
VDREVVSEGTEYFRRLWIKGKNLRKPLEKKPTLLTSL